MITGGIDMGLAYAKAVVLSDGVIIGRAIGRSGGVRRPENARRIWDEALRDAGVSADQVERLVATGKGRYDVPFRDEQYTEPICAAKAAGHFCPGAAMLFHIGADETIVLTLKKDGRIGELTNSQKCSAGYGLMLETMARRLGLSLEELSGVDLGRAASVAVSDGCMPFAELDALELLNQGIDRLTVAAAVVRSAAVRSSVVWNDVTVPAAGNAAATGGVTQNRAFMKALEQCTGVSFQVPEDAVYFVAAGAALLAAEKNGGFE